uniref:Kinesin motor domain-containing protein n=1 Tax=Rhodnius prolixus TaxID=13249 RepID=T1IEQ9_RHOPR
MAATNKHGREVLQTYVLANQSRKEQDNNNKFIAFKFSPYGNIVTNEGLLRFKEQEKQMVPFRESKLTQLFQHALLGNSGITMITNISQSDELTSETLVLKSTAVAMKIKAKPFVKKVISKRKSVFADYCSTRIDDLHAITSN